MLPSRVDEKVHSSKGSSFGDVVFHTAFVNSVAITLSAKEEQRHLFHTTWKGAAAILGANYSVCVGILYQIFSATFDSWDIQNPLTKHTSTEKHFIDHI